MNETGLLKIDDLVIGDHWYLDAGDECYYIMEYTAHKGFGHSYANQLIMNFKKSPEVRDTDQWRYKTASIRYIGNLFQKALDQFLPFDSCTLVPIPPSKTKAHALYDDRMVQALDRYSAGRADIRELIVTHTDRDPAHVGNNKRDIDELLKYIEIDENLTNNIKDTIVLFDDLVTTGCQFKACKRLLNDYFPDCNIIGIFVARRAIEKDNIFDEFMIGLQA